MNYLELHVSRHGNSKCMTIINLSGNICGYIPKTLQNSIHDIGRRPIS